MTGSAAREPRPRIERTMAERRALFASRRHPEDKDPASVGCARGVAKRFAGRGVARDDLEQAALLAIWITTRRYDPGRGCAWSSWAYRVATWAARRAIRRHRAVVTVPAGAAPVMVYSLDVPVGDGGATWHDLLAAPAEPERDAVFEAARERLASIIRALESRGRHADAGTLRQLVRADGNAAQAFPTASRQRAHQRLERALRRASEIARKREI